ncbi:MAG: double zinc ribbon domain-containing protein, partial [Pseudomonadota bacterium]
MNSRLKRLQLRLRTLGRPLLAAIMPQRCCFCGLTAIEAVCDGCREDLPWQNASCPRCALALPDSTPDGTACATCQQKPPPYDAAVAPLSYAFPIDAAIQAMKFQRRLYYLPAMSGLLVAAAARLPPGIDAVLPVPLHRFRLMKRGFNQSLELGLPVAKALGLPVLHSVRRRVHTPYQSGSNRAERRR